MRVRWSFVCAVMLATMLASSCARLDPAASRAAARHDALVASRHISERCHAVNGDDVGAAVHHYIKRLTIEEQLPSLSMTMLRRLYHPGVHESSGCQAVLEAILPIVPPDDVPSVKRLAATYGDLARIYGSVPGRITDLEPWWVRLHRARKQLARDIGHPIRTTRPIEA